jgi:hypothetical protein
MLCGACGQFFGNNPIWHFDGPGLFPAQCDWQHALGSQGSADVSRLRQAFAPLPWQRLAPDAEHRIVTDGMGSDAAAAMTAATADGRMAVTYVPSTGTGSRTLRVDLGRFAAPVALRWYNPCTGAYSPAADGTLANSGSHDFATPGDNGSETNDWLLILDANGGGRNAAPLATEEHR